MHRGAAPPPPLLAMISIALASFALLACGAAADLTPESTVAGFARALDEGRSRDAYDRLSSAYRARISYEDFLRLLEEHPEEVRELVGLLERSARDAEITATLPYGNDDSISLVQEEGGWRIRGNALDFYDQSTPRAALRSFVRAMERRRYDIVMRFVPREDLEGMTEARMSETWDGEGRESIQRMLARLRDALDLPIEEIGARATMHYDERFTVRFVREDGAWKIEDPE